MRMAMRIVYIAAGAGGYYCGGCARDAALVRGLMAAGHDVLMLPLYTPLTVDGPDPSYRRVFYGGINAYLEQHSSAFRRTPEFVDRALARPGLLRLVSRRAIEVRPAKLGAMTVSVLRGPAGRQAKELDRLRRFLESGPRPDVLHLTNSLLLALAPTVRARLGVPVVCTLLGEETFVAALGAPHQAEARALLCEHAAAVDAFVAPSDRQADESAAFLGIARERIVVVRTGIDLAQYGPEPAAPPPPARVGYLSRLMPEKGLDLLCAAFRLLSSRRREPLVLAVAGQASRAGRRYWRALHEGLRRHGLHERIDYAGAVDLAGKARFLRRCHVFCLPTRQDERRGTAVLEALAAGVPVVVPKGRGFEEIVALVGGVLVEPDDPEALASGIASVLDMPRDAAAAHRRELRRRIEQHFSSNLMVERTLQVYRQFGPNPPAEKRGLTPFSQDRPVPSP
jgi:glycosyltransferase involved in cell wall biosynthesis